MAHVGVSPLATSSAAATPGQVLLQSPLSNHGSPIGKENELQRLREEKKRYATDLQELRYVHTGQVSDFKRKEKAAKQQRIEADKACKAHNKEVENLQSEHDRVMREHEALEQERQQRITQMRTKLDAQAYDLAQVETQKQALSEQNSKMESEIADLEAQLRSRMARQSPEQQSERTEDEIRLKQVLEGLVAENVRIQTEFVQMQQQVATREAWEKMKRDSVGGPRCSVDGGVSRLEETIVGSRCSVGADVSRCEETIHDMGEAHQKALERQVELKREKEQLELEIRALEETRSATQREALTKNLGLDQELTQSEGTCKSAPSSSSAPPSTQQPEAATGATNDVQTSPKNTSAGPPKALGQAPGSAPGKAPGHAPGKAPGPPPPKGCPPKGAAPKGPPPPKGMGPKAPSLCKTKAQSVSRTSVRNGFVNLYWRQSVEPQEAELSITDDKFLDRFRSVLASAEASQEATEKESDSPPLKKEARRQTLYDVPCETPTLQPSVLAHYFKTRETAVELKKGSPTEEAGSGAPSKVSLMDDKRLRMVGILIKKFCMQRKVTDDHEAVRQIHEAVLRCDYTCLPAESLSLLRTVLRQHDEDGNPVNKFVAEHGMQSLSGLEHAPLYTLVYGLSQVDEVDVRLECMLFENTFEESFTKCRDQLKTLFGALNVLTSKREVIQRFFHTALRLGNALNKDSNAPVLADGGFKLCSLEKLQATKSSKIPRANVFHFVVALMQPDDVEDLCCADDWTKLRAASCVRSFSVYQQCVDLLRGYHYIEQVVKSSPEAALEEAKTSEDMFLERMREFTGNRKQDMEYVARFCVETFLTYKELGVFFDDVRGVYPPPQKEADTSEDLISLFYSFSQAVVATREDVKDLRLKEELLGACPWLNCGDSPVCRNLRQCKSVPDIRQTTRQDAPSLAQTTHKLVAGLIGGSGSDVPAKAFGRANSETTIPPLPLMKQLSHPMMTPPPQNDPKRPSMLKRLNDGLDEVPDQLPSDLSEWDGASSASSPRKPRERGFSTSKSHEAAESRSQSPKDSSSSPQKQRLLDSMTPRMRSDGAMRSTAPQPMSTPPRLPTRSGQIVEHDQSAMPIGPPPQRSPPSRKVRKSKSSAHKSDRKSLSTFADKLEANNLKALAENGDLVESGSESGETRTAPRPRSKGGDILGQIPPEQRALTSELRAEWKRRRSRPQSPPRQVDLPTVAEQGETPYRKRNGADSP